MNPLRPHLLALGNFQATLLIAPAQEEGDWQSLPPTKISPAIGRAVESHLDRLGIADTSIRKSFDA